MARKGKIDSFPHAIREEVCRRLHDGQVGREILAWLHSQEDVLRVLDEQWEEQPVSQQNLSEFRNSANGYAGWLERRDRAARIKDLSQYAFHLAEGAGGDLMASSAAIAGGQLLEILEGLDHERQKELLAEQPSTYIDLLDKLARLQKSGADARSATVREGAARLAERRLDLEVAKFESRTCELFVKYYADQRAREIAADIDAGKDKQVNMEALRTLIFGPRPSENS